MKKSNTILKAHSYFGGICTVEFTENGWRILEDTREKCKDGYLHICDESAEEITNKCRDVMLNYFYNHRKENPETPGIGATPQEKYWYGMSIEKMETIGNNGKKSFYA